MQYLKARLYSLVFIKSLINYLKVCLTEISYPRGRNLTFTRCPAVGNLSLAFWKKSNHPGSAYPSSPPPATLGLNIYKYITWQYLATLFCTLLKHRLHHLVCKPSLQLHYKWSKTRDMPWKSATSYNIQSAAPHNKRALSSRFVCNLHCHCGIFHGRPT